jgi:hypothetical protein
LDAKDAFDVLLDGVRYGSFQRIRIDAQSDSRILAAAEAVLQSHAQWRSAVLPQCAAADRTETYRSADSIRKPKGGRTRALRICGMVCPSAALRTTSLGWLGDTQPSFVPIAHFLPFAL